VDQARIHNQLAFHLVPVSLLDGVKKTDSHILLIRTLAKAGAKTVRIFKRNLPKIKNILFM